MVAFLKSTEFFQKIAVYAAGLKLRIEIYKRFLARRLCYNEKVLHAKHC